MLLTLLTISPFVVVVACAIVVAVDVVDDSAADVAVFGCCLR